jgi:hypothetical protein
MQFGPYAVGSPASARTRDAAIFLLSELGTTLGIRQEAGTVTRRAFTCLIPIVCVLPATLAGQQSPAPPQAKAETREANLRAYVELLRSDVRGQKVAIITDVMNFTAAEDAAFWPIYREYELELTRLNDERVTIIQEYADSYEHVTDAIADRLILKALDLEAGRTALKGKYYDRMKSALSAKTAARFLQVEHQLLTIIDLQIASSLPVVK